MLKSLLGIFSSDLPGVPFDLSSSRQESQLDELVDALPADVQEGSDLTDGEEVVLAGWAGLRRREILGLRAEDVDLEQSIMRVRQQLQIHQGKPVVMPPKYQSARDVPIAPLLEAELRPWVERALRLGLPFLLGRVDYDGLPPTWSGGTHLRKDGTPVRQNSLDIDLAQASAAAGIDPPATLRTLRATAQTLWREAGLPGLQIEIWIGHSLRGMGGQAVGLTRVSADHYQGQVSGTVDRALLN